MQKAESFKEDVQNRRRHAIEEEGDSGDELYTGCIENQKKSENSWMVILNLNGKNQKVQIGYGCAGKCNSVQGIAISERRY